MLQGVFGEGGWEEVSSSPQGVCGEAVVGGQVNKAGDGQRRAHGMGRVVGGQRREQVKDRRLRRLGVG